MDLRRQYRPTIGGVPYQEIIARLEAEKRDKALNLNNGSGLSSATVSSGTLPESANGTAVDTASGKLPENRETDSEKVTVNDIVRSVISWVNASDDFNEEQKKAANAMALCKTEALGGFIQYCPECRRAVSYQYCSCGNRNCPSCQYPLEKKWVEMRKAEIIPGVTYFHVTLTIPHELNDLFQANFKTLADLLFRSSSESVIRICENPKVLGARPGIISVMHTWNNLLEFHPHVHLIVSGGGLDPEGHFVNLIDLRRAQKQARQNVHSQNNGSSSENGALPETSPVPEQVSESADEDDSDQGNHGGYDYFFNVNALMSLFRGIFMSGLREIYAKRKLVIPESLDDLNHPYDWAGFCHALETMPWVGHLNKTFGGDHGVFDTIGHYVARTPMEGKAVESDVAVPTDDSAGTVFEDDSDLETTTGDAFSYLGRFAYRTAITGNRIESCSDKTVCFTIRDNDHPGQKKHVSLNVYEFVRRLLSHVTPKGFTRIRFSGFLACPVKKKNLDLIFRQLSGHGFVPSPLKDVHGPELMKALFPESHLDRCPHCNARVISLPFGANNPWFARGNPSCDK